MLLQDKLLTCICLCVYFFLVVRKVVDSAGSQYIPLVYVGKISSRAEKKPDGAHSGLKYERKHKQKGRRERERNRVHLYNQEEATTVR